jgi:hypothetical protein
MTTIKITQLTDIGSNLATSTVLPVVNMAGTPTTQKTTVGNIANLALSQAGNSYPAAAQAVLAQTVTNAAQPNITSTGTLTNVVVSGNATVNGNITSNGTAYVGNLSTTGLASITTLSVGATANLGAVGNVTITGGTAGQVLSTNGNGVLSWASDATSYGNSNVAAYLPTYTGNIGGNVVTANLFAGNGTNLTNIAGANVSGFVPNANVANTAFAVAAANVSGLGNIATINLNGNNQTWLAGNGVFANIAVPTVGNIATINLDGNSSNVLRGDGTFATDANSSYGNSNVVSLMTAFGSNTITTTGNVSVGNIIGNGQALTGIAGANVSGFVPNANVANTAIAIAGANVSGFVPNANVANTAFAVAAANVSGLGNIATINLTGSTSNVLYGNGVFAAIAGGGANTGNVTFSDQVVMGTGSNDGSGGLYLAPGNNSIANSAVQYLRVRGGDVVTHIHLDTGNNAFYDQYFGDDAKYVKLELGDAGNVVIGTDDANGNQYNWSFTSDGNLILAGGDSVIQSVANSSLDPLIPNVSTMVFTPDQNYTSQSLVLDPTAPGHIHLRAPSSNIDEPLANIFLGGEDSSFEVGYYNGSAPNLYIHSNNNTWTFGTDGTTTFPTGNITSNTSLQFTTTFANFKTVEYQTAGVWDLYVEDSITGSNTASSRLNVSFKDNLINKPQVYIENTKESDGIALRWTFDENGNLILPGNLVIAGNTSVFGTNAALIAPANNLPLLSVSSGSNGGVSSLWVEDIGNVGTSNIAAVYTNPTSGSKIVRIAVGQNGGNAGPNLWDFNANGTLTLPSGGNISTTGVVTANTAIITTGNITTINSGLLQNGNSNITITSNGNVSIQSAGSNVELVVTSTGANVTGTLTSTGKIGYASGSTVTQTSNRGNGVNINALAGTIVTVSASMTAGEIGVFSVTNNQVDTNNDIVLVQVVSPNLGNYNVIANPNSGIGGFYLTLQNISGFPISAEAVTIRFMVIKAPNA